MPAFPKVYTDAGATTEVAHTTDHSTTLNGALTTASTSITLTSATGWPTSGYLEIVDGTNGNETMIYYGLSGSVIQLAKSCATAHANGLTINQWYYSLPIGDQTNGIPNDGTASTPVAANTNTWYVKNAGDQIAQAVTIATVSGAPSTSQGQTDTNISHASSSSGFSQSDVIGNMAVSAIQQIWVDEQVPNAQNSAGNPQLCVISISFSTV